MKLTSMKTKLIESLQNNIKNKQVIAAIAKVPREQFIPPEIHHLAYEDRALPIGHDQTISQPYIVALMTEALQLSGSERVLEIGTGSGYQTAILAELSSWVVTVERISEFVVTAKELLNKLGYHNIEFHTAGEDLGWKSGAPYDAIMVTAGAPTIPVDLVDQLSIGGCMIIPVGTRWIQQLYKVTRNKKRNKVEDLGGCRFVSLIGKGAWED
jgi:protein-L-isoaspartate(D-aspartate) O-methyltransferase